MSPDQGNTSNLPDPREALRKRMVAPEPVKVYLAHEGDNVLGRFQYVSDQYPTRFTPPGKKGYAAILAEAEYNMLEEPDVPDGGLVAVLLLGYAPRALRDLSPAEGEWIGIRRGPKATKVDGSSSYNTWDVYSARSDAGKVDLSELADDDVWTTGLFDDKPNF